MKSNRQHITTAVVAGMLLAGASLALRAGETNIINGAFDNLAPSPSWYWENWSLGGSGSSYDAQDAGGGAVGSGSLRLTNNFAATANYQQAVYTIDGPDFNASDTGANALNLQSVSFDLKVDAANSSIRVDGNYAVVNVILRYGGNWDWNMQADLVLDGASTTWKRYTIPISGTQVQRTDIRAITLRVGGGDQTGPVVVNIDNIAFNDEATIDNFDDADVSDWFQTYSSIPVITFDTQDELGRTNTSGAMKVAGEDFVAGGNGGGWQQAVVVKTFPAPVAMSGYTRINCDVYVLPDSTPTTGNQFGYFEIKNPADGSAFVGVNLTATGVWTRVSAAIPGSVSSLNGVIFQLGNGGFLGPVRYLVDNISFTPRVGVVPPPVMSLSESKNTGLKITASAAGQYQRQSIAATSTEAQATWWYDNSAPVTYAVTVAELPLDNNFQFHIFLSPNSGGANSPDWNDPAIIFLDIRQNANGSGFATFRYKTNNPGGNDMLYFQNGFPFDSRIGTLGTTAAIGTWSLTFLNNTNITLSGPGGASTNFNMLPEHAAFFNPANGGVTTNMTASFGIQPNQAALLGRSGIFKKFKLTSGATTVLEDNFDVSPLDTSKWTTRADDANGVSIFLETGWLVRWTIPDTDFYLQGSSNVNNSWYYLDVPYTQAGVNREALIPPSNLPSADSSYFRLVKTNSP